MKHDYFDLSQQAARLYGRALEPVCRQWDLTKNELDVLLFLHNNPEYDRAADIVTHRGMTKSHVSLSLANLRQRNLVRAFPDPEDRRILRLELTEKALEIGAQGRKIQENFFAGLFADLDREDVEAWLRVKETIGRNIRRMQE